MKGPEPLADAHDVSAFECGVVALDEWIRATARHAARVGSAKTQVIHEEGVVLGYYSLTSSSVRREDAPPRLGRAVAPLDDVPVLLLARLAVHRERHGQGLGKALLKHVLATTKRVADVVGVRALLIDAIDASAEAFYAKYGCKPFPTATGYPRRLYLLASVIP